MLLTRDEFREGVFARDKHKCVACGSPAKDAHHLIERRLFSDGGYYLDNGVSLCAECHLYAEATILSPETLRDRAGITRVVVPPQFDPDVRIDKWGNPYCYKTGPQRFRGPLWGDESVQKILGLQTLYVGDHYKFPRILHLPNSQKLSGTDRRLADLSGLEDRRVIVHPKEDGQNTSLYSGHLHGKSLDSCDHPSMHRVKAMWGRIRWDIPSGWRICGENLALPITLRYENRARFLSSHDYFLAYHVWDSRNICLGWDATVEYLDILGIRPVGVLYDGPWPGAEAIAAMYPSSYEGDPCEGLVVRDAGEIPYRDFWRRCAKWVSGSFVQRMDDDVFKGGTSHLTAT